LSSNHMFLSANPSSTWLHRRIYYLAVGFMFSATVLRSILIFQGGPLLSQILRLFSVWLLLLIGNSLLSRRAPWFFAIFIGLEMILVLVLLLITRTDFFAFLFAIAVMQAMQQYTPRVVGILIGLSTLMTFIILVGIYGKFQAFALALVFAAGSVFLAVYIWSTRQSREIRNRQQVLVRELNEANRQIEFFSQQKQQLAAARERRHLARELHDSVTQTIFSMTLTTQSALLLLERDRQQVAAQLDRLDQLARNTLAEMQILISRLAPENIAAGGFINTLQQHLADRHRLDNLSVFLEVEGVLLLAPEEEAILFRIAQEALNNIVKHAQVSESVLRVHLDEPFWMEIEDKGCGFNPQQIHDRSRLGLASMHERATEINWHLQVETSPGKGTRIRVEKG